MAVSHLYFRNVSYVFHGLNSPYSPAQCFPNSAEVPLCTTRKSWRYCRNFWNVHVQDAQNLVLLLKAQDRLQFQHQTVAHSVGVISLWSWDFGGRLIKRKHCMKIIVLQEAGWWCPVWFQNLRSYWVTNWCTHLPNK